MTTPGEDLSRALELFDEDAAQAREGIRRLMRGALGAASELRTARVHLRTAEALIESLIDYEPCRYDHDGECQEHGPGPVPCHVAEARKFLKRPR